MTWTFQINPLLVEKQCEGTICRHQNQITISLKLTKIVFKNPNLRGPNGEPSELLKGIDMNGNNVEILHHKWGHQFKDNNTFERPHFQGPNGEHLSYPR